MHFVDNHGIQIIVFKQIFNFLLFFFLLFFSITNFSFIFDWFFPYVCFRSPSITEYKYTPLAFIATCPDTNTYRSPFFCLLKINPIKYRITNCTIVRFVPLNLLFSSCCEIRFGSYFCIYLCVFFFSFSKKKIYISFSLGR